MLRSAAFAPLALLVTLLLFYLMAQLAGIGRVPEPLKRENIALELHRLKIEDQVKVREREPLIPPPTVAPPPPPPTPEVEVEPQPEVQPVDIQMELPEIAMDVPIKVSPKIKKPPTPKPVKKPKPKPAPKPVVQPVVKPVETVAPPVPTPQPVAKPVPVAKPTQGIPMNVDISPAVKGNPSYPRRAQSRRIQGFVVAEYLVDAKGKVVPSSFKIVQSKPPKVFDRAVKKAVLKWRYTPTGSTFRTRQRVEFKLN